MKDQITMSRQQFAELLGVLRGASRSANLVAEFFREPATPEIEHSPDFSSVVIAGQEITLETKTRRAIAEQLLQLHKQNPLLWLRVASLAKTVGSAAERWRFDRALPPRHAFRSFIEQKSGMIRLRVESPRNAQVVPSKMPTRKI